MLLSIPNLFLQTNNAQEGANNMLKRDFTLRERLPFNEFKMELLRIVSTLSSRYDPAKMKIEGRDVKKVVQTPVVSNEQFRTAHEWTTSHEEIQIVEVEKNETVRCFLMATPKFEGATAAKITEMRRKQFDSFDDYRENGHKMIYETCISLNDCFLNSTCTCGEFTDIFMCKHIIGFCLQLRLKSCPKEGNSKQISSKRKAGRTSRAKKALVRQN